MHAKHPLFDQGRFRSSLRNGQWNNDVSNGFVRYIPTVPQMLALSRRQTASALSASPYIILSQIFRSKAYPTFISHYGKRNSFSRFSKSRTTNCQIAPAWVAKKKNHRAPASAPANDAVSLCSREARHLALILAKSNIYTGVRFARVPGWVKQ